jgi:hypothetical protein
MRRLAATLLLGSGALLLVPGAPGSSEVPGDPTPPVVTPVIFGTLGSNGWYTSNVTVNWTVTDPESIILSSTGCNATTLTSDTTGTQLTCRAESDGGITTVSKTIKADKTAPTLTPAPSRPADAGGWYNHALTVSFPGDDGTSGISACTPTRPYNGPDSADVSVSGSCTDNAGNSTARTFTLNYDATAPQLVPAPSRPPNANDWYRQPFTVAFPGVDAISGIQACTAQQTYQGVDNAGASIPGSCTDKAGNTTSAAFAFRYDETAPTLTPAPSRAPDSNGWYTRALTVSFSGNDATSGVEGCSSAVYSGSDSPSAAVTGSCRDSAGNVGGGTFWFKYDATAPSVRNLRAVPGNRSARVTWAASPDTRRVEVRRAPGRRGESESVMYRGSGNTFRDAGLTVGRRYRYRVTGFDEAANTTSASTAITAAGALFSPAPGEQISAPPRLRWTPVQGADYYNLQLIRGRRVLSVWPSGPSFQLRRTWTYKGRRHRLRPGVYRWYVWPGFGPIADARYGRLIGSSRFVVRG